MEFHQLSFCFGAVLFIEKMPKNEIITRYSIVQKKFNKMKYKFQAFNYNNIILSLLQEVFIFYCTN
jgi:hypothetical protein